ncbi:hypothetical protein ACHAWU_002688 [Discostella pseudostelligera]|uniref:Uncharacterized protein n=1 Tax=Discostella pseudostelligera TaxID=259834 RepID=A0ABD3MW35_9STRA
MKLPFLFLVTPFVAAAADVGTADERGVSPDDSLDVDLIGANDERPIVLADLDTRNRGSSNRLVGQTSLPICSMPKDFECYNRGVPKCCDTPEDLCPVFEPMCDIGSGNYCQNGGYDYVCYPTGGLPACCSQGGFGLTSCPRIKPDCETNRSVPGPSYCYFQDYGCYQGGIPKCCDANNNLVCPPSRPMCDLPGLNYCTGPITTDCYFQGQGRPACCLQNSGYNCPFVKPDCDPVPRSLPPPYTTLPPYNGQSYCYFQDYGCYQGGIPKCCDANNNLVCPPSRPMCDLPGLNYCTGPITTDCYFQGQGRPACCLQNSGYNCPFVKPDCDPVPRPLPPPYTTLPPYKYPPILPSYCNSVDNDCYRNNGKPSCCGGDPNFPCPPLQPMCDKFNPNNYCRTLDNECYFNGFPSCCLDRDGIDCPMEKPPPELPCELSYVSSDETVEVHYLRG